jgi:hypothetical protein
MAVFRTKAGWTGIWLYTHEIDFGEDGTTREFVGIFMNMTDGVAIGNGMGV